MGFRNPRRLVALLVVALTSGLALAGPSDADEADLTFFEEKIRPVLVEKCYRCHSAEAERAGKLKGGLRLDTRSAMLEGGPSGPAVVPGDVEGSLLIEALRYDFLQMPPEGKLPDPVISDFEAWIDRGAPDPRDAPARAEAAPKPTIDLDLGRQHWAYRLPEASPPPEVDDESWAINNVDRFLLAKLESKGLRPVADADRETLIRRLSFDLVGLPPTPEQIDAFLLDESPDAYEKLVDHLLASPQFGERWGRHWLDLARFAESLTLRGLVFKEAWRYRDYVIDAFNEDRPFDQFIREQIAGDLLPADNLDDRRRKLAATTFLVLGNNNLEEQDKEQLRMDVVDEQIETIGKAILAQTIACARCHDHKFDPIPTADYYAIAGILRNVRALEDANVSNWIEVPMPMAPDREEAVNEHEQAVAALEALVKEVRAKVDPSARSKGVLSLADAPGIVVDDSIALRVGSWKESTYSGTYLGDGYLHDDNAGKGDKTLTFQPTIPEAGVYEVWVAYSHGQGRASAVPVDILSADGDSTATIDMRQAPPIDGRYVSLGRFHFEANDQGYLRISNEGTSGHVTADAVLFIPVEQLDDLREEDRGSESEDRARLKVLEAELKQLKANAPARDRVMTVVEESEISDIRVHIRGTVHNLGDVVPRGFLRVATYGDPLPIPPDQSGRRELADWLAAPENPLTARVIVNRAWHWLFGSGIVPTVDNFGTTGEAPSHPELLDTLAVEFMAEGWSLKSLVRKLVLSRAYRLSATDDPDRAAIDPENRLYWRANRRRLDAECIRDAILAASGRLDLKMHGRSFSPTLKADYNFEHVETRRSVYAPVFRNALPDLFEVFDFADPSMVVGRRNESTVAPQALFLMNHPFVIEQSQAAARRLMSEVPDDDEARIELAYRRTLGRRPTEAERQIALEFVTDPADDPEDSWTQFVQVLFTSIDFRYVR